MYKVQPMRRVDIESVSTIEQQTLSPWSLAMLQSELQISEGMQLVAIAPSGGLAGWCCSRLLTPEAELLKIAIDQDIRKSGVGSMLLLELCNKLEMSQIETLFLEVRATNHGALQFYRKNSFFQVGRRPNYYTDPTEDALILQKQLAQ